MAERYEPEPLDDETPLPETLEREHRRISTVLETLFDLSPVRAGDIRRPEAGMLRWYDAAVLDPGQGTGLYVYDGAQWQRLKLASEP